MASKLSHSIGTHTRLWYLIDARHQVVGRLASMVALLLQGKNKPIYHPSVDTGDHVVVINTGHAVLTGSKWDKKLYRHHTGYPGGLKEIVAKQLHQKNPTMILRRAINGMLPKNLQRKHRMRRLHLYPDSAHSHALNITHQLPGPCPVFKTLSDYSSEEITSFPDIVTRISHL
ncbi:39S ribosomal protein L13, mitochondrial [Geodia barretti]|uniref:Large ribosomal subunit protein uL13m n=1 Tax=Geodia barretti TaxID=519541 RepID=A0AA35WDB2_GEOBA|nr:39S ribosomal protein L13, mitochondrial [Geodia barretti]